MQIVGGAGEVGSSIAASLGFVEPGFSIVGPVNDYEAFPWFSTLVMTPLRWVGRLEILPVLVLLTPTYLKTQDPGRYRSTS